jgi:phosphoribosylaminoimidazole-succinocarboxamide synthase
MDQQTLAQQIPHALTTTDFDWLGRRIPGKARDNYVRDDTRVMIATDRVSAFDRSLGCIPFKGQLVTQASLFWFDRIKDIAPNHVIASPDPNVIVCREYHVLPVEFVVRAYVTGVTPTSIWYQYSRGARVYCGHRLPDGLKKNAALPEPILTPSTKAAAGQHDRSLSADELVASGAITRDVLDRATEVALAIFRRGQQIAAERGVILVDTKYELGLSDSNEIVVIDEVHTPDSSRFWFKADYEQRYAAGQEQDEYDKEYIRLWLAAQGFEGDGEIPAIPDAVFVEAARRYITIYETLSGKTFAATAGDPRPRIAAALQAYFAGASPSVSSM